MKIKPCIICKDKPDLQILVEHKNFRIIKCKNCGLIYQDSPEQHSKVDEIYNSIYSDSPPKDVISRKIDIAVRKQVYSDVEKIRKPDGLMLDIGCSYGESMMFFEKKGWKTIGIDICETSVKWAKDRGLNCIFTSVENYTPAKKFDVIVMSHVLEHFTDPVTVLRKIKKWLKPDGIIHIRVPNIESKLLNRRIFFLGELSPFQHLYYFSPNTVGLLLKKVGLNSSIITRYKHSLASIINMVIRSRLVLRSSWHELNYQTNPEKKLFYLRIKNLYEKIMILADFFTFGANDREVVAIAGNLDKKDMVLL